MINFSIIIPHYNIPELLKRCVNSIPVREDVQVIVVDDCSPKKDETIQTIENLSHKRKIELFTTPFGGSAGRARNIGLNHAKGKWLIFADADDFFDENLSQTLDKLIDNDSDVIYLKCKSVLSDDITRPSSRIQEEDKHFIPSNSESNKRYFRFKHQVPWGKIIKRSIVVDNDIKFDETRYANDAMFAVSVGCYAKHVELNDTPFYVVTEREDGLCSDFFKKPGEALIRAKVALRVRKKIQDCGFPVDNDHIIFLKILLWQKEFKGLKEIYIHAQEYGISKEDVLNIVYRNGLRYRPIYFWLKLFS